MNGTEASVESGSFDSYKGRFSYGDKFKNGVELLLSGSYYTSAGQRTRLGLMMTRPSTASR